MTLVNDTLMCLLHVYCMCTACSACIMHLHVYCIFTEFSLWLFSDKCFSNIGVQNMRVDFQFDKAAFAFNALPFKIPYPVPFKLLGDETKVFAADRIQICSSMHHWSSATVDIMACWHRLFVLTRLCFQNISRDICPPCVPSLAKPVLLFAN